MMNSLLRKEKAEDFERGILESDLETLVALGLTVTQAKVYLVVNRLGKARASAICKPSGVVRQDLYRVLSSLQEIGLIEKMITVPTEYTTLPLAETMSILLERKRNEFTKLQTKTKKLLAKHTYCKQKETSEPFSCKMIPTGEAVGFKTNEIFDRTTKSVEVLSSVKRLAVSLQKYGYEDLLRKGVKIKILTNLPREKGYFRKITPKILTNPNFSLRYTTNLPATVSLCFDIRETLICTDQTAYLEGAPMIWCNFPSIVNMVHQHFKMLWKVALKDDQHVLRET